MGGGEAAEVYECGELGDDGLSCGVVVSEVAVAGRMVALDLRLKIRRGMLGEASCNELGSVDERTLTLDLRLKSRCGMLGGFSCDDEGEGGEEEVSSEEDGRKVALDFRLKSCILFLEGCIAGRRMICDAVYKQGSNPNIKLELE